MSARHSPIRFKARVCVLKTGFKWENTHKAGLYHSFGFSFHDAPLRLGTLAQQRRRASTKHTKYTLINCAQAEMTWQNSQLRPRGGAPADSGSQIPRAEVPSIQSGRLRPLRGSSPRGRGSGRGGPTRDRPCAPVNPVPSGRSRPDPSASQPRGPSSTARPRPAAPTAPSPLGEPGEAVSRPRQREPRLPGRRAPRPCRAAPACLPPSPAHSPPPGARRAPATPADPILPRGRRSGPAWRGMAGRPRRAGAEEGAAAATMSARPSQKRGASGQSAAAARGPRPTPQTPAE